MCCFCCHIISNLIKYPCNLITAELDIMRLTVTTLADEIFTFEVSEDMELDSFRALCEIETGISAREIVVFWNGRPLHDDKRNALYYFF